MKDRPQLQILQPLNIPFWSSHIEICTFPFCGKEPLFGSLFMFAVDKAAKYFNFQPIVIPLATKTKRFLHNILQLEFCESFGVEFQISQGRKITET